MAKLKIGFALKQLQSEEGSALTSVMIMGAVILILVGSFASYQFQRSREIQAQDTRNVYNTLKDNMKSGAAQTQSVSKTEELDFGSLQ